MGKDILSAKSELIQKILPLYGKRETGNIARIIFEDVFGNRESGLLSEADHARLVEIGKRLVAGEPLQYITGIADFYGLKLKVNKHVLIPRPETEELVFLIIETIRNSNQAQLPLSILDIGTGSGCIPITLKKYLPMAKITGADISSEALEVAESNSKSTGYEVNFLLTDILNGKEWAKLGLFDLIVSNPPYIPEREKSMMHPNVLEFEPGIALFVEDKDPLVFYRAITGFSEKHLNEGGYLFLEINEFQSENVKALLMSKEFREVKIHLDMQGKARIISGVKV